MKRALTTVIAALALTGCAPSVDDNPNWPGQPRAYYVDLPDGRKVLCVDGYKSISCDWGNAK